jgi:hypothetical protein
MTKDGVITLEPQNGAEAVALKHWEQENRIMVRTPERDQTFIRDGAIEVLVK